MARQSKGVPPVRDTARAPLMNLDDAANLNAIAGGPAPAA